MPSLRQRIDAVMMQAALAASSPAASIGEDIARSHSHSQPPPGAFQSTDNQRIEELFTRACATAESLLGVVWKDGRLVAQRVRLHDEREWTIHILARYEGVGNRMVAAEEHVEYYVIRDLRKKYGFDGFGVPLEGRQPTDPSSTSILAAVSEIRTKTD